LSELLDFRLAAVKSFRVNIVDAVGDDGYRVAGAKLEKFEKV
jgi:hypothetical protein